ncbi:MAG: ABC transporter ATP-binding protein [Phycisphaeraceae bacterium]|nr:MAG: ABC transporter ATP-binding protein [Phycisphaeraceae bacterium]
MPNFWLFARHMLKYPWTVAAAMALAVLSASSLGAGLLGLKPILDLILGDGAHNRKGLPELAADLNTRLGPYHLAIPQPWIDALPTGPFTAAVAICAALGLLTIIGAAASFGHLFLSLTVVNQTLCDVRRRLFYRVLRLPLKDVVTIGPSDIVSRIIVDSWNLTQGFTALLSKAIAQVTKGLFALTAAFILDFRMTAIALLVSPLLVLIIRKVGTRIRRASREALAHQATSSRTALEALQGLRVVKVHTTEAHEAGRFRASTNDFLHELNRVRTAKAVASPLVETVAIFAVGTLFLVAVKAILDRQLSPADLIGVLVALATAGASLRPLTGLLNDIQASAAAADRLAELHLRPPEPGHGSGLPPLPRLQRSIRWDRVSITYPNAHHPALHDISLTVRHGETVAFVGPNGSGKTTLLALVPRLFDPSAGHVLIDDADTKDVSIRSLRRQIGVVTQETIIFHATVRENIAYGLPNAPPDAVHNAARQARAHDFIARLPHGYDTVLAEQGLSLSGGQRQRLAIARAILRDPTVLILDEATSMIDAESEAQIADALSDFAKGRTCLIVAHRLSTVLAADRIVVLDQGRIVDQGSHHDLLARCPVYRQIAERQLLAHPPHEPHAHA